MAIKINKQHGLSIVEIVLAIAIFSIAVLGLITFEANLTRERVLLNQRQEALTVAQNQLQEFRRYTVINTTSGKIAYNDITDGSDSISGDTATYNVTWTVITATDTPDRKTVNVQVQWTSPKGDSESVSLNGVIAKIDPTLTGQVAKEI